MNSISEKDYLQLVHNEILRIMDEIHRVCEKYNLHYYLVAGSLLGAVRHNGFIPWDDDLDIGMPRSDFNRFIKIASSELKNPYKLEWITTDQSYYRLFPKVVNSNTAFYEQRACGTTSKIGIFVDIFPLDRTTGNLKELKLRKYFIRKIGGMLSVKGIEGSLNGIKGFITEKCSRNFLYSLANCFMTVGSGRKKANYITNFTSQYSVSRQTMKNECYGEGQLVLFEDRYYFAPIKSDIYLTHLYGDKYMDVPPIEKRRSHYPLYIKFENGLEIHFEKVNKKVKIEDTLC